MVPSRTLSKLPRTVLHGLHTSPGARVARAAVVLAAALMPLAALGADRYVTPNTAAPAGNGTQSSPYNSITAALNVAVAGDVVRLLPGTYYGPVTMPRAGEFGRPITLMADAGPGSATIDCRSQSVNGITASRSNVIIDGLTVRNAMYNGIKADGDENGTVSAMSYGNYGGNGSRHYNVNGADNVVIRNCTITSIGFDGLKIGHLNNIVIENNDISECGLSGQQQGLDMVGVYGAIVRGNYIHDDGASQSMNIGMFFKGGSENILVENNRVENMISPNAAIEIGGDTEWYNTRYTPSTVSAALGFDLNAAILTQTAGSNSIDSSSTYLGQYMAEARHVVVRGNLVSRSDPGISLRNAMDVKIYNNTVTESGWSQAWVKIWNDGNAAHVCRDLKFYNNVYRNQTVAVRSVYYDKHVGTTYGSNQVGFESDSNLYWNASTRAPLGAGVDMYDSLSVFVDPRLDVYSRPEPNGPAHNTGTDLIAKGLLSVSDRFVDRYGTVRPEGRAIDLGALEYNLTPPKNVRSR